MSNPWSPPDKPVTALAHPTAEDRALIPRNQHGRYVIPGADGVKIGLNGRTRVSTTAKVGQDTTRLQQRAERLVAAGLAKDPGLAADAMRAMALEEGSKAQRQALQKVTARAFAAAGGHDRANRGTTIHALIERINRGEITRDDVAEDLRPDVDIYYRVLAAYELEILPEFMERVVICPYEHGGALDNIMRRWNPVTEAYELVVVDLKTGATLDYSKLPILSQLWFYANAYYMFVTTAIETDDEGKIIAVRGYAEDMPLELRTDVALIIHLDGLGAAEVHEVDISGVGRTVKAQVELRRAELESDHKFRSLGRLAPDAFVAPAGVSPIKQAIDYMPSQVGVHTVADGVVTQPDGTVLAPYAAMVEGFGDKATDTMRAMAGEADHKAAVGAAVEAADRATGGQPIGTALVGQAIASRILDGTGKPLGPLADKSKGERGCSVCGRKGHKSTSPKCLKDADPGKITRPDGGTLDKQFIVGEHASTVAALDQAAIADGRNDDDDDDDVPEYQVGDKVTVGGIEFTKHTEPPAVMVENLTPDALPYCTPADHPGPCGWTERNGLYVCGQSGKPSKMVWELQQAATLAAISQYLDPQTLLTFRQTELTAGRWTPEHEAACLARYGVLAAARG